MRGVYWGAILFILPVFLRVVAGGDLRFAKDGVFLWSALLGTGMFGVRAFNGTLRLAFVVIGFLTFWNQYHPYSVSVYHQSMMVMCGWLILAQGMDFTPKDWDRVIPFLWASLFLQAIWPISNAYGTDPWEWIGLRRQWATGGVVGPGMNTIIGMLHNPSISAALLAGCIPFVFTTLYSSLLIIPALVGLYYCGSSMAWLGLIAALGWFILLKWRRAAVISALFLPAVVWGIKGSKYSSDSGRFPAWARWGEHAQSQGWWKNTVGNGVGYISDQFPLIYKAPIAFKHLHNELMEIHAAWGGIGLLLSGLLFMRIKDWRSPWFYSFLILWVNALGNLTFHISATTLLMILCYAKITQTLQGVTCEKPFPGPGPSRLWARFRPDFRLPYPTRHSKEVQGARLQKGGGR